MPYAWGSGSGIIYMCDLNISHDIIDGAAVVAAGVVDGAPIRIVTEDSVERRGRLAGPRRWDAEDREARVIVRCAHYDGRGVDLACPVVLAPELTIASVPVLLRCAIRVGLASTERRARIT